jgi:hypothetical protein
MVMRWSMGDVGADEGDVRVCVGGGHVMVAMWLSVVLARGCEGAGVLVVVV